MRYTVAASVTDIDRQTWAGRLSTVVHPATMYVGLAQAFYAGSGETEDVAGIGIPGEKGWTWEARPKEAAAIGKLIKMHAGELPAEFVAVPVKIK